MVIVTQYFDTLKEIGAASKSYDAFIPQGYSYVCDIATQISDELFQGYN